MSDLEIDEPIESIAIIGMAGRFPGANTVEEFWRNLRDGVESISVFTDEELEAAGIEPRVFNGAEYVKAGAVLDDIAGFDAAFFDFTPREAETMDPQQRLFLECAWQALEDSGYDSLRFPGRIGVYAGANMSSYLLNNLLSRHNPLELAGVYQTGIGNDKDHLATRVSYKLNLKGPSITVQTACSTSLVAVHLACQSLLNYQCDMALAGGVSISVPHKTGYRYQPGLICSPDGHCRAFDARAQGTVFGNGLAVVVLTRLADALAARASIRAIIKGSAVNNDGAAKVGYTAPSIDGQAAVIAEALALAGVCPSSLSYVEAHGTATPLGDPIEVAALQAVFGSRSSPSQPCALGSVKTNIGHLDAAAGVAGLIKTVLALQHRQLPPSLHFAQPNPAIAFADSPFYVNTSLTDWPGGATARRAGVSSFGIGGTNAHVVLEEAPAAARADASRPWQLLALSARSAAALESATRNLHGHLREHGELALADVAYTLLLGRRAFAHRRVLVCRDQADALRRLEQAARDCTTSVAPEAAPPVVFVLPGQGTQYVQMGAELYRHQARFRAVVDQCAELLVPQLGLDLREVLYPEEQRTKDKEQSREQQPEEPRTRNQEPRASKSQGSGVRGQGSESSAPNSQSPIANRQSPSPMPHAASRMPQSLDETWLAQPALFVVEYALAQLWMEWGVQPQALLGHSLGEYVAATLAGVFDLPSALALIAARGRLMQALPEGAMLAVGLSEAALQPWLLPPLALAAVNAPGQCVLSGPLPALERVQRRLSAAGVVWHRLPGRQAFHSALLDRMLAAYRSQLRQVKLRAPKLRVVSSVTGQWLTAEQATDSEYWVRQLREPVRFAAGLQQLMQMGESLLLEVGPGQTLRRLVQQQERQGAEQRVLSTLGGQRGQEGERAALVSTLGELWQAGVELDWGSIYAGERRRRVALPGYPFEHQRYWLGPGSGAGASGAAGGARSRQERGGMGGYMPVWKQSRGSSSYGSRKGAEEKGRWLIFVEGGGVGVEVVRGLEAVGQEVTTVEMGREYGQQSERGYRLDARRGADYGRLLRELADRGREPSRIVHLWSLAPLAVRPARMELFAQAQEESFWSVLWLSQALAAQPAAGALELVVVTSQVQEVTGEEPLCPEKATLLGFCKVIPQEYPHITCRSIDISMPEAGSLQEQKLVNQLLAELTAKHSDSVVAYRGNRRWVQTFEPLPLDAVAEEATRLREEGAYLVVGGLQGIGFGLTKYLAQAVRARLILIENSPMPHRDEWKRWLLTHDGQDSISRRIRQVHELEAAGAAVLVISADIGNREQMEGAIARASQHFGYLHAVIYAPASGSTELLGAIQEIDRAECERYFRSKVHGLLVLEQVLQGRDLDFCLLQSSLSTVLGGRGMVVSAAANHFIDVFACKQNRTSRVSWRSVSWDAWDLGERQGRDTTDEAALAEPPITSQEGFQIFEHLLAMDGVSQVIISTRDLPARIDQRVERGRLRDTVQSKDDEILSAHPRPNLPNCYVPPGNDIERSVAAIWQDLLGIEPVGIHDNFFELGGHSLLATQLISRLRETFQVDLPIQCVFEGPTVANLALALTQSQGELKDKPINRIGGIDWRDAEQMLAKLDSLSNEEMTSLLNGMLAEQETDK